MSTTVDSTRLLLFADRAAARPQERAAKIRRYRLARLNLGAKRAADSASPRYADLKRAHD